MQMQTVQDSSSVLISIFSMAACVRFPLAPSPLPLAFLTRAHRSYLISPSESSARASIGEHNDRSLRRRFSPSFTRATNGKARARMHKSHWLILTIPLLSLVFPRLRLYTCRVFLFFFAYPHYRHSHSEITARHAAVRSRQIFIFYIDSVGTKLIRQIIERRLFPLSSSSSFFSRRKKKNIIRGEEKRTLSAGQRFSPPPHQGNQS